MPKTVVEMPDKIYTYLGMRKLLEKHSLRDFILAAIIRDSNGELGVFQDLADLLNLPLEAICGTMFKTKHPRIPGKRPDGTYKFMTPRGEATLTGWPHDPELKIDEV